MNDRFAQEMADPAVAHDTKLLGDFADIYCSGEHADRERTPLISDAAQLGVYGRRVPVLCDECAEHVSYAEKRRAYCPKDPKPFCANCDTHCYRQEERVWQQEMMRYSGPKSWKRGYAVDGIRHAIESRKARRDSERALRKTDRPSAGTPGATP
jgi:hypothetical protein